MLNDKEFSSSALKTIGNGGDGGLLGKAHPYEQRDCYSIPLVVEMIRTALLCLINLTQKPEIHLKKKN